MCGQAAKAKREAEMLEKGGGKMAWIELDMTGKPLEEVIEYEVRRGENKTTQQPYVVC